MAIQPFLAMTAAEMKNLSTFSSKIAWMACHFSPYGLGLSNLPRALPPGSLLILDDVTPPRGHDPDLICQQLLQCVETLSCCGVLLDFQRESCQQTGLMAQHLTQSLPCPVVVSKPYIHGLNCPVLLPPVPLSITLQEYLAPWKGREIWLEIGLDGEMLTLTEQGCNETPLTHFRDDLTGFPENTLHCHYRIETDPQEARFALWRTEQDLRKLLEDAQLQGIAGAVGLFQELHLSGWYDGAESECIVP